MIRNQLVLRNIAPHRPEWWSHFFKDIQFRGFKPIHSNDESSIIDYKTRYRIQLDTQIQEADLWLYPKFKVQPTFLKLALVGLGAGILIVLGILFLLFESSFFQYGGSVLFIMFPFIIIVMIIMVLAVIFKGHSFGAYGLPARAPILMEIYQAARYAEKQILTVYPPSDQPPSASQKFCTHCGKTVEPTWMVCPFCGTALQYK